MTQSFGSGLSYFISLRIQTSGARTELCGNPVMRNALAYHRGTLNLTFPPNPFNRAYDNSGWSRPIERG